MKRELTLKIGNEEVMVTATREGQAIRIARGDEEYTVQVLAETVVGSQVAAAPAAPLAPVASSAPRAAAAPAAPAAAPAGGGAGGPGAVPCPMTGVVDQVLVQDGASVAEGDKIVILEAMKMYIDVTAPAAGTVSGVAVKAGDSVKEGQSLMTIG